MSFGIDRSQYVAAAGVRQNLRLGAPSLTILCGHCGETWKTRFYYELIPTGTFVAKCPCCHWWNDTGLAPWSEFRASLDDLGEEMEALRKKLASRSVE